MLLRPFFLANSFLSNFYFPFPNFSKFCSFFGLCLMASLQEVRDRNWFLAKQKIFDCPSTEVIVDDEGVIHRVEFDLSIASSYISDTREMGGVSVERNFYLTNLDVGF